MKKLLTLFTLLLTVCSGAWADTVLFTTNFSTADGWDAETSLESGSKEINGTTVSFKDGGSVAAGPTSGTLTFGGNSNITDKTTSVASLDHYIAIPVTGVVGGTVTVTTVGGSTKFYYCYSDGSTSTCTSRAQASTNDVITITGLTSNSVTIYIGSKSKSITKLTVTTPELADLSSSSFYPLYKKSSSSVTADALISDASLPSYVSIKNCTSADNGQNNTSSVTSPHNFSTITTDRYYRLKPGTSSSIVIGGLSHVKSIRVYGNGSGSNGNVVTSVSKIQGTGTTFTVGNQAFENSKATIVEYSTGDLTKLPGYDADTYYQYTITFSANFSLWGVYVEYAAPATPSYTITLDDNGDYQGNGSATVKAGDATLTISSQASRTGYIVKGYYAEAGCETKIAEANGTLLANKTGFTDADGKWTATENKTLYADWEAATYTLTNEVNTEGYGTVSPASVTSIAYNTATSSSTNTYTVGETVVTATPAAATAEYTYAFESWSGLPANVTEDATVTANFTRIPVDYTLSWNANGGDELTGEYTTGTVAFGTSITAPNTPTYDGHVFIGWAESADGAVVSVPTTMPAADKTYYAQWMEGTAATITYDLTTNTESTTFNACKSATPTSGDVVASTTINTYGTAGAASSGQSAKSGETQKLNIDDSYTTENYYEWTFTENGCTFAPTNVKIKFQAVSGLVQYKVALTDGITTKTTNFVQTTSAGGTLEELDWDITDGTVFAANKTVKLQIWAYKKGDGATAFRLGSPITIKGAVKSIPASVSGTITEAGWNTFSSNYALDLSTISGGTAYVATTNDNTVVTMTKTTAKIAAGTGIMIKGNAGETFTISTTTDAATLEADNQLVGLPNGGTVAANAYNFVFAWETGDVLTAGFYYVDEAEPTLPAGKAYLNSEGVNGAKLSIVIDDTPSQEETDGIKSVQGSRFTVNGEAYNLSGQRVGADYKGLVIINGKKVIRK